MKIIVLVKEVPDTYGERKLDLTTGLVDRGAGEPVLDEIGERALEVALSYAESHQGTDVRVLTVGPAGAAASLRKALAIGADAAIHVEDPILLGADLGTTADAIAAAVQRAGFDLVIAGNVSTDGGGGVIASMIADLLGVASATSLSSVAIGDGTVSGTRITGAGSTEVTADLPAVISITEALPDARFANFRGIMAAKKKPIETWRLADLGLGPTDADRPQSIVIAVAERPPRQAGTTIIDEGDAGTRLAEFLVTNKLA